VYALDDGVVIAVDLTQSGYCGVLLGIRHLDGLTAFYCHLSKVLVKKGDHVTKGQKIALTGRTGKKGVNPVIKYPHLHITLRLAVDKIPLYERAYGKPNTGYGSTNKNGTSLPGEPLIPAPGGYRDVVVKEAVQHNVPLYGERPHLAVTETAGQSSIV
jgi:murein DD-endopeptidase MepM/ murein hydrolase activator NlpD